MSALTRGARRSAYRQLTAGWCDWCGPTHQKVRPVLTGRRPTGHYCCDDCWGRGAWVHSNPDVPPPGVVRRGLCTDPDCTATHKGRAS